eukprot:1906666-Prymnesium_polylepis.2
MGEQLRWTPEGVEAFVGIFGEEISDSIGRPAADEALTSAQLVEMINAGDTMENMVAQGRATGEVPVTPASLVRASDEWQAALTWPLQQAGEETAILQELKSAVDPLVDGLPCAAWASVCGELRLL